MIKKGLLSLFLLSGLCSMQSGLYADTKPTEITEAKIKLYIYPNCPYCKRVIKTLESLKAKDQVLIINANDLKHYNDLKAISKKDICPYLVDEKHNIKMGESSKIIEYFKKLFS